MATDKIRRGVARFQKRVYPKQRDFFQKLALGQRPSVLFITCSDSRIDPSLLTQSKPGELFICRVIGNLVPKHPDAPGGVSATIEYAVAVLRVTEVIVCGHTDCGVMKGVLNPENVKGLPKVSRWLKFAKAARRAATKERRPGDDAEFLLTLTEQNVIEQLKNLRTHPSVAARLLEGDFRLHGWVYHIAEGIVTSYDEQEKEFCPAHLFKTASE